MLAEKNDKTEPDRDFAFWNRRGHTLRTAYKPAPEAPTVDIILSLRPGEILTVSPGFDVEIARHGHALGVLNRSESAWLAGGPHVYGLSLRACRHFLLTLCGLPNRSPWVCANCGHAGASCRLMTEVKPASAYLAGEIPPMECYQAACPACGYEGVLRVDNRHPEDLEEGEAACRIIETQRRETPPDESGSG